MKKIYIIIAFYNFVNISLVNAQDFQYLETPVTPSEWYEQYTSDFYITNINSYKLKGEVKSMKETFMFKEKHDNEYRIDTVKVTKYEFLENHLLNLYTVDDSLHYRSFSRGFKVDRYLYDNEKNLLEIVYYSKYYQKRIKRITKFDNDGYLSQEIYTCDSCGYDLVKDKGIFDYTLNYKWNKNRDTVKLEYTYKTPSTGYQRGKNESYSFVGLTHLMKKELTEQNDTFPKLKVRGSYFSSIDSITFDDRGNIIKWVSRDYTVKNTFNVDYLYEYKYNEKNELIEISVSNTIGEYHINGENKFPPGITYKVDYLKYDKAGNWITKKITEKEGNREFLYNREIEYY